MSGYEICTEKLLLRPVSESDIEALHALWTDAAVRKHLWDDEVISREAAAAVVGGSVASFAEYGFGQWAVRVRGDDAIIGFCGLRHVDDSDVVEILYGFYPAQWGKGFATESARAVIGHGFEVGDLREIVAEMDPPNGASIRVAEKLGMAFAKEYEREGLRTLRYVAKRGDDL